MRRRKLIIATIALVAVIGLATVAASDGVLNLFDVKGPDISETDAH